MCDTWWSALRWCETITMDTGSSALQKWIAAGSSSVWLATISHQYNNVNLGWPVLIIIFFCLFMNNNLRCTRRYLAQTWKTGQKRRWFGCPAWRRYPSIAFWLWWCAWFGLNQDPPYTPLLNMKCSTSLQRCCGCISSSTIWLCSPTFCSWRF